jgi:pseudaminic acid biosynthesis-associated methylase
MMSDQPGVPEAVRLEQLWSGEFGDQYVERNRDFAVREAFWADLLSSISCQRVLEVGCNLGGNLQWIAQNLPPQEVYGVDVNLKALRQLRAAVPDVNAIWSAGRELPFRDGWFDLVFTFGVLIHQPDDTLPLMMAEMVRTSRRYVLCGEYFATQTEEVPYRGEQAALFRRDYGGLFGRLFPELELKREGFLSKNEGWDDITWWLFEKGR